MEDYSLSLYSLWFIYGMCNALLTSSVGPGAVAESVEHWSGVQEIVGQVKPMTILVPSDPGDRHY